jgi:hypothetical protein
MSDPRQPEPRYDTGETAQEAVDRQAGNGGNPPHPSAAAPTKPAPANLHPIAKGVYGSPVTQPILGKAP